MRIGILTGGGDVPGLNPAIKAVVREAAARGWEVIGFRQGWAGLLNYNPDDPEADKTWLIPLNTLDVRKIDRTGGTILHTSRTNPTKVREKDMPAFLSSRFPIPEGQTTADCTPHILQVLEHLKIDTLIPIGGDDTLSYGARLHTEGFKVMEIPKTMDNDVFGTEYCLGFSTAITRSVGFINALRTSTGSHERIAVVELFGRNSGETALISGYLADADRTLLAEVPADIERLAELVMEDRKNNPSNYAMIAVSEGATIKGGAIVEGGEADAFGHQKLGGIGQEIGAELKRLTGIDILNQTVSYLMRTGEPDPLDKMVATNFGTMAIQLLDEGKDGLMMAIEGGRYTVVPGDMPIRGERRVDVDELYDSAAYKPRISHVLGKPMFLY